ncbi:MAG: hypothetical protein FJ257_01720 [Phycisphaerae bacterium]|nr:hypothetical protein [Phycisphaerae bacterium]
MPRRIRTVPRSIAIALAAVLPAACDSLTPAPFVAVEDLTLRRVGPDAAEAEVRVRITDRTGATVVLDDFRYSLLVDGRTVFTGRWAALAAVPPEEPMVRTLPVVIPLSLLPATTEPPAAGSGRPFAWSITGSLGWEDPNRLAKILLDLGFPNPRTNFAGRGEQLIDATIAAPTTSESPAAATSASP